MIPLGIVASSRRASGVTDTFTRTDSLSLGVSDSGQAWAALVGTWGTDGSAAALPPVDQCLAVIDPGSVDVTATITLGTGNSTNGGLCTGVTARTTDSNNHYIFDTAGRILKKAGGTFTSLGTIANPVETAGATLGIRVSGSTITLLRGGVSVGTVTDATLTTGKAGMWGGGDPAGRKVDAMTVTVP